MSFSGVFSTLTPPQEGRTNQWLPVTQRGGANSWLDLPVLTVKHWWSLNYLNLSYSCYVCLLTCKQSASEFLWNERGTSSHPIRMKDCLCSDWFKLTFEDEIREPIPKLIQPINWQHLRGQTEGNNNPERERDRCVKQEIQRGLEGVGLQLWCHHSPAEHWDQQSIQDDVITDIPETHTHTQWNLTFRQMLHACVRACVRVHSAF